VDLGGFADSLAAELALVVLVPGLLALVFGWLAFRSRVTGVYLSILTQAMTLALSLYLFQNDTGLRGNNGLSGLQNLPGDGGSAGPVVSVWFFWASALALGLGYVACGLAGVGQVRQCRHAASATTRRACGSWAIRWRPTSWWSSR
jgi:ABC-type branched-subunit amino acid transport system permease subunit